MVLTAELNRLMGEESDLLARYARLEERLPEATVARRWPELERMLAEMEELSRLVEETEGRRESCFRELKRSLSLDEEADFHRLARSLPEEERGTLAESYRRLKIEGVRVRSACARMGHYFRAVAGAVNDTLGELFPHRKGRLYSRRGQTRHAAVDPFIVDRRL